MKNEGKTALWKGLTPTLAMAGPSTVIYFVGYDILKTAMIRTCKQTTSQQDDSKQSSQWEQFIPMGAGALARGR